MEYSNEIYTINDIQNTITSIAKKYPEIEKIILFGSYARNEAFETSDIDLIITKPKKIRPMLVFTLVGEISDTLKKPVEIFRESDVDSKSDFNKNITKEGITIYEKD